MTRCWRSLERALALAALAAVLAGCVVRTGTVVLLPQKDGREAAVTVRQGEDVALLDQPFAAADLTLFGPRAYAASADEVNARFGPVLAAQPLRPEAFTLYFAEQTDALTEDSRRTFDDVFARIASRPVPDIVVIGHTDTVGSDAYNDELARKRAEAVRGLMIARGIAPASVVAVGRGKRELAVPTREGVAEPRNRRVEILVR